MTLNQQECGGCVEDGASLLEEEWVLQPPAAQQAVCISAASRATLAAALLALGLVAMLPTHPARLAQVRTAAATVEKSVTDLPFISFQEEGKSSDAGAFSEAVGHSEWDSKGRKGSMDVERGVLYWVQEVHKSGWAWATTFDGKKHGWVPDSALYHGNRTVVHQPYKSKNMSVSSGDTVWVLEVPGAKADPGWVYVFANGKMGWISSACFNQKGAVHRMACFVNKSFTPDGKEEAQLAVKKGEVVWTEPSTNHTARWIEVENKDKKHGWVPRNHLIESQALPILKDFTKGTKVDGPPKPLLYVKEGDAVWVDDSKTKPHWIYAYFEDTEGFVPEWALMEVSRGSEVEEEESEDKEPDKDAPKAASKDGSKDGSKDDSEEDSEGNK
mmetsp:Transcript_45463/g.126502  ORF Transcript_45463/g.126502 Transcript_45463/m.126502 type:complete len:385 (-) Transcript_45463:143-1297(-)